jgi:hypothetical protein
MTHMDYSGTILIPRSPYVVINGHNLQNLRCEINRTFRNKKREYLKDKINELENNNKTKILEICTET